MNDDFAFIGDVHGSLQPLVAVVEESQARRVERLVMLGDYIDKGDESAAVLRYLDDLRLQRPVTLLQGNHEEAFLFALETGKMAPFLRIGGAATIRSFVPGTVGPDVSSDLRAHVPQNCHELLRSMPTLFETDDLVARHQPAPEPDHRFEITGHRFVGQHPRITHRAAALDTGCGTEGGRLTAFLWPSRRYFQVDVEGQIVTESLSVAGSPSC